MLLVLLVAPYTPVGSLENLFPGTWYITHIDNMHRRSYARKPLVESSTYTNNGTTVVADTKSVAFNSESQRLVYLCVNVYSVSDKIISIRTFSADVNYECTFDCQLSPLK